MSKVFCISYFCNMLKEKTFALHTLGCKLNFSESSMISRQLKDIGFKETQANNIADLFVINTCSVTENANKECERIIRKTKNKSPDSFIVVTGCFAQLKPKSISQIEGVDMVLGANEKFNLPNLLKDLNHKTKTEIYGCELNDLEYKSAFSINERTRSFLKIQDGCDYTCTYCTIPLARGKSRCDSVKNIVLDANKIAKNGVKEIVITGVNIGEFEDPNTKDRFINLIHELDKVEGIERYRISSIEPNLITNEIIEFVAKSKKFMPHFHIPMQSGSDFILGKMRRRYQSKLYQEKIQKITESIADVSIGADVIVGFPGEEEKYFEQTYNFIKTLPLSYLHVFPYSERENTKAIDFKNKVRIEKRRERSKKLRILSKKLEIKFSNNYLGSIREVLLERENKKGYLFGFTDNYIKIKIPFDQKYCETKKLIKLSSMDKHGIINGEIIT